MDYIRLFDTETNYNTAKDNFEYPTVSYIEGTDELKYMPIPPHDYSQDYLTFEALESGTFTLTIPANVTSINVTSVSYSTDNGETWITTNVDNTAQTITTPTINAGGKVIWKGVGTNYATSGYMGSISNSCFSSTINYNICGNIMSMRFGDNFKNIGRGDYQRYWTSSFQYNFAYLFKNSLNLVSAENLIIPAVLSYGCYTHMFDGCTGLTTAPLTLTDLLVGSATSCYSYMFNGCTSLTTAPALPATTLGQSCYSYMFYGCTALTTAPALPATTLTSSCYSYMFYGCTNLNYIKAMFTTTPSTSYTSNWVSNVAASGTFVKNSAAQWNVTGVNGIPSGWTVQTASE